MPFEAHLSLAFLQTPTEGFTQPSIEGNKHELHAQSK